MNKKEINKKDKKIRKAGDDSVSAKKNSTNNSTIPTRGRSVTYIPFAFPRERKSVNFCTQATNDKPAGTSR